MKKFLLPVLVIGFVSGCKSTGEPTLEQVLRATVNEVNKTAPQMVDSATRLDGSYYAANKFVYKYTMINYSVTDLDAEQFHKAILEQVSGFVCTSPDMKFFVENNVDVGYSYFDKANKYITEAVVKVSECDKI
ncbi:hypothetical protein ACMZOO_10940 [Catenovulum sp. SX2]|uniref:hypothetical protein n=1 Tax=Catenovulum sp. SX2 TaxID=3398614 RepID=UPI003F82711F